MTQVGWQGHDTGPGDANAVSYLVRLLFLGMTSLFGDLGWSISSYKRC
jgi:hypothetical protein